MYNKLIKKLEEVAAEKRNSKRRYDRGFADGIDAATLITKKLQKEEVDADGGFLGIYRYNQEDNTSSMSNVSNYVYWEFDVICATFIRHVLRNFIKKNGFHPYHMTNEEWLEAMAKVADGFDKYINDDSVDVPQLFADFGEIFPHLWT